MKKEMEDISKLFYRGPKKAEVMAVATEATEEVEVAEMSRVSKGGGRCRIECQL